MVHLNFEGVIGYGVAEADEADHFFGHILGLALAGEEGSLRFYALGDGAAVAVDVSGATAGEPPYLLFSADDLTAAAEHFLERGCSVRELPWAAGSGFLARSPEGHTVCVIAASDDE
jgi:catechol 2,3-dioxygenase-like lactoylglutathione lyase family enzyme